VVGCWLFLLVVFVWFGFVVGWVVGWLWFEVV
jgi:hypothetical protein